MDTATVNYGSAREAREHFKDLLDAADDRGGPGHGHP